MDGKVPKEAWFERPPSYDHLCVFGYKAYVHIPRDKHSNPTSRKCIFIGYGDSGELWDLEARKIVRIHDVFNEAKMHKKPEKTIEPKIKKGMSMYSPMPVIIGSHKLQVHKMNPCPQCWKYGSTTHEPFPSLTISFAAILWRLSFLKSVSENTALMSFWTSKEEKPQTTRFPLSQA